MEFHVHHFGPAPDMNRFAQVLLDADPCALFDLKPEADMLQVSTIAEATELLQLLQAAGCPAAADQIEQLPSMCCGECST